MSHKYIVSAVLGMSAACAAPSFAQWWWPPTGGLTVTPACLDPSTTISLRLSGQWPDSCIPNLSHTQVNGAVVDFFTVRDPPPGNCLTVISNWSRTELVGPLPPGFYTVFATHLVNGSPVLPRTQVGSFEVIAACPASCYANCDASTGQPVLNVNDFICFLNRFAAADTYANCDASTTPPVLNVNDFTCFLNRFAGGCS